MGSIRSKIFFIALSLLLLTSMTFNSIPLQTEQLQPRNHQFPNEIGNSDNKKALTHETIGFLSQKVMENLIQPSNENYLVKNYNSKADLVTTFQQYASLSLAKKMVDLYYKERDQKLFIIPTETPPWFDPHQTYTINEKSNSHMQIVQKNQSEQYGEYTITMDFIYKEKPGWILHDVSY